MKKSPCAISRRMTFVHRSPGLRCVLSNQTSTSCALSASTNRVTSLMFSRTYEMKTFGICTHPRNDSGVLGSPNNTYLFTIRENYTRQRVYAPLNKVAFIKVVGG